MIPLMEGPGGEGVGCTVTPLGSWTIWHLWIYSNASHFFSETSHVEKCFIGTTTVELNARLLVLNIYEFSIQRKAGGPGAAVKAACLESR